MAKKSESAPEPNPAPIDEDGPTGAHSPTSDDGPQGPVGPIGLSLEETITVPQEVVDAFGGVPIPPPVIRVGRPTVTRVGEPLAKGRPDPGGLLAPPRPERRESVKRIDQARTALSTLIRQLDEGIATAGARIGEAIKDPEVCEAEGFDPIRANALVEDLAAVLSRHFAADS